MYYHLISLWDSIHGENTPSRWPYFIIFCCLCRYASVHCVRLVTIHIFESEITYIVLYVNAVRLQHEKHLCVNWDALDTVGGAANRHLLPLPLPSSKFMCWKNVLVFYFLAVWNAIDHQEQSHSFGSKSTFEVWALLALWADLTKDLTFNGCMAYSNVIICEYMLHRWRRTVRNVL